MNSPNDIEKSLQRLMPAGLSQRAHRNVSQMIADLAAKNQPASAPIYVLKDNLSARATKRISLRRKVTIVATVAALVVVAVIPAWINHDRELDLSSTTHSVEKSKPEIKIAQATAAETVLLERLSVTDHEDSPRVVRNSDGSVVEEINRKILTRERYRAGKNGYLITISESREEKVLIPKSSF